MNQTFFNFIITYNGDSKHVGLWAMDAEEAREKGI